MERRGFLKRTGAALAAAKLDGWAQVTKRPMNLLWITVDDMDASLPGFMGGRHALTPNLDALAARSHRFVRNRTTGPICQPSREAMMTGRVPHRSGGVGFVPIHDDVPTMVTTLKAAGYFTAGIHKLEHMQPATCFPWDHRVPGMSRRPGEYAEAVRDALERAEAVGKPFFINCNINDPHRPFYGSPGGLKQDSNDEGEYKVARELTASDVEAPVFLEDLPDVRREFAQYCNSAQRMDVSIGRVLQALRDSGQEGNTVVVFCADHGMPFPFSKATVYDHGTREPVLLSWPGMPAAKTHEERTCNIDLMPTLLELLGVQAPAGMDGRSWMPMLRGGSGGDRKYLVTHVNSVSSGMEYPQRAIQDERYSLVFMPWADGALQFQIESMQGLTWPAMVKAATTDEGVAARVKQFHYGVAMALYDLQGDPGQRVNLVERPEHKARVAEMQQELLASMKRTGDPQLDNLERYLRGEKMVVVQVKKTAGARE